MERPSSSSFLGAVESLGELLLNRTFAPMDINTDANCDKCSPFQPSCDPDDDDGTAFAVESAEDLGTVPRKVTVKPGTK